MGPDNSNFFFVRYIEKRKREAYTSKLVSLDIQSPFCNCKVVSNENDSVDFLI